MWLNLRSLVLSSFASGENASIQDSPRLIAAIKFDSSSLFGPPICSLCNRMCFGVQVTGPGIANASGPVCSWKVGQTAGYVPSGENAVLVLDDIPKGNNLRFEIYGYLRASTSDTCGVIPNVISQAELDRTYFLGQNSKLIQDTNDSVEITINIPAEADSLSTRISLASSCPARGVASITPPNPSSANFTV